MATARDMTNPYDDGLGAGGKFKKRPFRRSTQSTPYDRPPTAVRNASNNGWLSKLVDPAQRLITSSAYKLFASVFRKGLPSPPPPLPVSEQTNQERRENHQEATLTESPGLREGAICQSDKPGSSTDVSGFNELVQILKKKTFTRSEIDRLTSLLHSRSVDNPNAIEEKLSEVPKMVQERKEQYPNTLLKESGTEHQPISTPLVSKTVPDEDVASPAELAKAYMGSRPSKVSSSIQNFSTQALVADSTVLGNGILPSKSHSLSLVPRHSVYAGGVRNGFVTPRSLGRSAIYNMARTPYSRVHSVATLKGGGLTSDGGPSSSSLNQNALEQGRLSASGQGALKRRSSVLDNDIGSVGPIRRIRQKSNLLTPKILNLPPSRIPLSIHEAGSVSNIQHPLSPGQRPASSREAKQRFAKTIVENEDMDIPGPSSTTVPSKSSEMASKILQQLGMLVSTKEKSPAKMSPSMLRGQALRSLENVDSPKFLDTPLDKNKVDESGTSTAGVRDSTLNGWVAINENGPTKLLASIEEPVPAVKCVNTGKPVEDNMLDIEVAGSSVTKPATNLHQGKKWAFQMSAHEDLLVVDDDDDDDDDRLNGAASTSVFENREKLDIPDNESKSIASEAVTIEKSAASEVKKFPSSEQKPDFGTPNGSTVEKTAGVSFATVSMTNSISVVDKVSSKESYAASPIFTMSEKVVPKETNAMVPMSSFGSAHVGKFSSDSSGLKFASFDSQSEKSLCAASVATSNIDLPKVPESNKADNDDTLKPGIFVVPQGAVSSAASTSSLGGTIFSFAATGSSSSLTNGSLSTSPFSVPSSAVATVSTVFTGQSSSVSLTPSVHSATTSGTAFTSPTTQSVINGGNSTSHASAPSFTSAPGFKFVSSVDASTSASTLTTNSSEQTEVKTKDAGFGNLTSAPFGSTPAFSSAGNIFGNVSSIGGFAASNSSGGTSATTSGTDGSIFSGTSSTFPSNVGSISDVMSSAIAGTSSNIFSGTTSGITAASTASTDVSVTSTVGSTGSNIFGFSAPAASSATMSSPLATSATGLGTSTQSIPIQFGSSASSPSVALAGNTSSSENSLFGSPAPMANPFSSGSSFGFSASSSGTSGVGASSFNSGWEAPKSPFGLAFTSSSSSEGLSFGVSSASVAAANSAPTVFGSSASASSSSLFPFTSAAAVTTPTSSQPFGGSSPSITFGLAPSNNNDQMEDSMAEDTVQASTPGAPLYGEQAGQAASPVGSIFGQSNQAATPAAFIFGQQPNQAATPAAPIFGQQPNQAATPAAPIFGQQPNQAATPAAPIFGQQNNSPGIVFGVTPPSVLNPNPFQSGSQQNTAMAQNLSPFPASGSTGAGGSFSLGSGGGDKSNRRIVRVNRSKPRKK